MTFSYTEDLLSAVGIFGNAGYYASSITYHPNLMVNQVVHNNNPADSTKRLTDTYAIDTSNMMRRPASITITTPTGTARWSTGTYQYDGAGNISAIGTHTFNYDKVSRLKTANLYLEPTSSATLKTQTYTYDAFGNIQSIGGNSARNTPTSASTNHLTSGTYDASGSLISLNGNSYAYDPFNLMWNYRTLSDEWIYLYTAADERAWSYKTDNTSLWTLRDPANQVLREYSTIGGWNVASDYIYRGSSLLAAETPQGIRHFHLDHLGTPRLISDSTGQQKAYHVYYPFGEEATAFNQDTIRAKFTGHERDLGNPGGAGDDLDYMHARHCSPMTGRFLKIDPAGLSADRRRPQTWNKYSYALSNPLRYIDPDGQVWKPPADATPGEIEFTLAIMSDPGIGPMAIGVAGERAVAQGVFRLPQLLRGTVIERMLANAGGALSRNFPVIDRFLNGIATSVKSIDLTAKTYQVTSRLFSKVGGYIRQLAELARVQQGTRIIGEGGEKITERVLEVAVQKGAATPEQLKALEQAVEYGKKLGVTVKIVEIPVQ